MANTIRENIMTTFVTRLETITIANGYSRDVQLVKRMRVPLPENPVTPSIWVYPDKEVKSEGYASGVLQCSLAVFLVYLERTQASDQDTLGNAMLNDITKALGSTITLTGGGGLQTIAQLDDTGNDIIVEPSQSASLVNVLARYEVTYAHANTNQENVT